MQPQQKLSGRTGATDQTAIVCTQCGSPMPKEMRFCRSCGNRLGEGPAEYTETVRFPNATAANAQFNPAYIPSPSAPIASTSSRDFDRLRRRVGWGGMSWLWIVLAVFFVSGGAMSVLKGPRRGRPTIAAALDRSIFGVDGFKTTEGGVTFEDVEPPGAPADKAGLVGGDIITSFDGRAVRKESELMDLIRQTPIGKTVEVIYLRDGEIKKTQLAPISRQESSQLERAYGNRAEGRGMFGYDDGDAKRVFIPTSKIFGVRLDTVLPNGPADLAGIKRSDIVIEFDKTPIRTSDELLSRVRRGFPYSTVTVAVMRDGQRIEIPVKLGKG
jgi:membrane-associated protease RseP (regulator of RpoE activity)